jgi:UDP-3-O-[3-hydroxymyristoyl] glucosamine N-acyltransferase
MSNKKPLIFLGGSLGLDSYTRVCELTDVPIHGILDDNYFGNTDSLCDVPVVGSENIFDFESKKHQYNFFIGASMSTDSPKNMIKRLKMIDIVNRYNLTCSTLIHPHSEVYSGAVLAQGCYVGYCAGLQNRVTVGAHSLIMPWVGIGHDCNIGSNTILNRNAWSVGCVTIGNNVVVGTHSGLAKNNCVVGNNSVIHPGITVLRDVEENEIVSIGGKNSRRIYKEVTRS